MKNKRYYLFALIVFLCASVNTQAQTLSQLIKAADEKFEAADYYAASLYYKDALKKNDENVELNFKLAESLRGFNNYEGASEVYGRVLKLDKAGKYPLAGFWLGEMLRSTCICKTDEAEKQLKRFKNKYHKKDFYSAKAQQEIEACIWVGEHQQINDTIEIQHLGKEVNTENSEFNPIPVFPDKIQFSSLRNISDDKKKENYLARIYNQNPNPEKSYMPNGADPNFNVANGAFSPDSKRFYFTQCEQKNGVPGRCDIYVSLYYNYKWMPAEKLSVNDSLATNTQPAIGYNTKGNEVLFFSSDRAGGQGGMDIWYSNLSGDRMNYSEPINLGPKVNTLGNEVTPFYDINNNKLFFSSDWYYGFGGYDIFETTGENTNWTEPRNLLQPINTPQNDLYYTIAFDNSKTYLSSNRKGSYFIKSETCCNDIYAYNSKKMIKRNTDTYIEAPKDTTPVAIKTDTPTTHIDTVAVIAVKPFQPEKTIETGLTKIRKTLPVLYFHNDEPDCCNLRDTTSLDYKETYEAYSGLYYKYQREFSKGLRNAEKDSAEKEVRTFFAQKVDQGFYNLVAFSSQLLDLLRSGSKVEVTIKGYCSPLNFSEYNIKLGYRRVASLKNYFNHYQDGILLPYLANGSLILKSVSFGKETAPKDISDKLQDLRNSVYNPRAALERRVEIISVELK